VTCKELPYFAEYLDAGQDFMLPDNVPRSATIVMEGYMADMSIFDITLRIDRSHAADLVIS